MANPLEQIRKGDLPAAEDVRQLAREVRRGARPLRVVENSGLTLRDDPGGQVLGTDMRKFTPKQAAVGIVQYAYVLAMVSSKPDQVLVQFLDFTVTDFPVPGGTPVTRVQWSNSGDPRVAIVPPNFLATDFEKLKRVVFGGSTPIVRVEKFNDRWVISLIPRWAIRTLPDGAVVVRCN